jgi:hypothetical protein
MKRREDKVEIILHHLTRHYLILAFVYLKFFSEIYPYFYFIFYLLLCVVTNKFAHGVTKFARVEI